MKKVFTVLMVMMLFLGSFSMANSFTYSDTDSLTSSFNTSESSMELSNTVNSVGDSVFSMMKIVGLVAALIEVAFFAAVISLIVCAIKSKKAGGFSNSIKKSFLKVFLIISSQNLPFLSVIKYLSDVPKTVKSIFCY